MAERTVIEVPTRCPECGRDDLLRWDTRPATGLGNTVPDGRLCMREIHCTAFLACEYCDTVVVTVAGDDLARLLDQLTAASRG